MVLRKRPLATGVAALLFSSWVSAVGLGEIQLNSALNEPLDAEIRLHNLGGLTESDIIAGLASARDFTRAGLDREAILSELSFNLDLSNPSAPLLRVNSKRPIREPYLDFLIDVRWPSGRLLREYTVLLDLPVYAADRPATSGVAAQPRQSREPTSSPAPLPMDRSYPAVSTPLAGGSEYRVSAGETLWSIASRLSGSGTVHSKLQAIHQLNPEAFIDGDIHRLREGEILRLPSGSEVAEMSVPPVASTSAPPSSVETREAPPVRFAASSDDRESDFNQFPAGRLKLSAIDPNTSNENELSPAASAVDGSGQVREHLQSIEEELARTQRENQELRSRLGNLEEQLVTMRRLIEMSSEDMRAAQLLASDNELLDEPQGVVHTVAQEAGTDDDQADEEPAGPSDLPGEGRAAADPALPSAAQEPARPVTQARPAQPQVQKGWSETVSSYLIYILGVLAALIAVVVAIVLRRRHRDTEEEGFSLPATPSRHERVAPDLAKPSEAVEEAGTWSQVSSLDDIALDEGDDLFADASRQEPSAEPRVSTVDEECPPAAEPEVEEIDDIELDLSEFELDDFAPETATVDTAEPASLDEALGLDDFDFLGDADEGETQLGLAQAYLDMGDPVSAREILQEVIDSGAEQHRERARAMLAELS